MRRFLTLSCVLVVAATAVWTLASRPDSTEELLAAAPNEPAQEEPAENTTLEPARRARTVERASIDRLPAHTTRTPASEIRGRFRFADGTPAANVLVALIGDVHPEREHTTSAPLERAELVTQTDEGGVFSLQFVSPPAFEWSLFSSLPGHARLDWVFPRIDRGLSYDLGNVALVPGGSLVGRVVDSGGNGLAEGWNVHAVSSEIPETEYRVAPLVSAEPTSGVRPGEFVLDDLEPGVYDLYTLVAASSGIRGPTVTIRSGEVTEATIVYEGPALDKLIAAHFEVPPFGTALAPYRGDVALTSPTGTVRRAGEGRSTLRFADLAETDYTLTVDDPRFEPWRLTGLAPGASPVEITLTGSSALRLDVRDAATLSRVPNWSLRVRYVDAPSLEEGFTVLHHEWETPPPGGLFDGIVPDRMMLIISAPGYSDYFKLLEDLGPEETRTVNALLKSSTRIAGRILDATGEVPELSLTVTLEKDGRTIATTRTDFDGRFEFESVGPGVHSIRCDGRGALSTRLDDIRLSASEAIDDLTLHVPRACYINGQLEALPGATFAGLAVEASTRGNAWVRAAAAPDGSFWLGPLAPGIADVKLVFPRNESVRERLPFGRHRATEQSLGRVELEGENVVHRFDLEDAFPGRLAILMRTNGEPAAGVLVAAHLEGDSFDDAVWSRTDAEGMADFGVLPAGRWNLVATALHEAAHGHWMHPLLDTIEVAAYEDRLVSVDAPFVFGELLVLDGESGEILSDSGVVLTRCESGACVELELRTDGEGRIAIDLPPGTYRLSRSGRLSSRGSVQPWIDWTFDGPLHSVVKLPY